MSTDPMQTADHMSVIQPDGTLVQSPDEQAHAASTSGSSGVSIPGYEIECELGRGGMGVVYKAKQTGLNRTVALKMVIAGPYADPATRARFLLEAESVAAMEHPNVVKVFAFGEHDGHPFLAMEFLSGGSLAGYAKARGPLPANEATTLVAKVSSAVAHAHSRGVVHRDIKPANVLLTPDGDPRLTDFGLAKVGRSDLSVTGQVLGTPAYMAPEQAAGKVHEVGTAADVYALGAVLYDLLIGRPPFRGDSVAVTLQQVLTTEPERPRSLNPSIPHDLETVCLKCLEKEPAKRYPTAQAVADDLYRFLAGEPITARAVGRAERTVKWVKRHKVTAGAMAAVTLALVIGTVVSIGFGLEAQKQAKVAKESAEREKGEAGRADKERDAAIEARNDLQKSNDDLNAALASALLGPIRATYRDEGLTPYEKRALWDLSSRRGTPVARRFLDEATSSPMACKQLAWRAEYAYHAAIGLDLGMKQRADRLLADRMSDPNLSADHQLDLAFACSQLRWASQTLTKQAAEAIANSMAKDIYTSTTLSALLEMAGRMEPAQATDVFLKAANVLADALSKNTNDISQRSLANKLEVVAGHMEPSKAAVVLIDAMLHTRNAEALDSLAGGLAKVAARMEPAKAAEVCTKAATILIDVLAKTEDSATQGTLTPGLARVAARMEPAKAAEVYTKAATILIDVLAKTDDAMTRAFMARSLADVVSFMESGKAAVMLVDVIATTKDGEPLLYLAEALSKVAARMGPAKAAEVCSIAAARLIDVMTPTKSGEDLFYLADALTRLADRMEPGKATETRSKTVAVLAIAMTKTVDSNALRLLADGLLQITERMEPAKTAEIYSTITAILTDAIKTAESGNLINLASVLVRVTARMPPSKAAEVLIDAMYKTKDAMAMYSFADGLAAVAPRMEGDLGADVCSKAATILADAMTSTKDSRTLESLASAIAFVASRMHYSKAAVVCGKAAAHLADMMTNNKDSELYDLAPLATGLLRVTECMRPAQAAEIWAKVTPVMTDAVNRLDGSNDPGGFGLVDGFVAVVRNIDSEKAAMSLINATSSMNSRFNSALRDTTLGVDSFPWKQRPRAIVLVVGSFANPSALLPGLPLLHPDLQPHPKPLRPQTLVDLLKHPFCVGEARRAVLDALEFTYNRKFTDQWEFVQYVRDNKLPLDLLTPPKRPQPNQ